MESPGPFVESVLDSGLIGNVQQFAEPFLQQDDGHDLKVWGDAPDALLQQHRVGQVVEAVAALLDLADQLVLQRRDQLLDHCDTMLSASCRSAADSVPV